MKTYKTSEEKRSYAKARHRRWVDENPERARIHNRRAHLRRRYGMPLEKFEEMYEQQNGQCLICEESEATDVDHEKPSGRIRGLLCHRCNWAMGIFGDNADRLRAAADYLER